MDISTILILIVAGPLVLGFLRSLLRGASGMSRKLRLPKPFTIANAFAIDGDTLAKGELRVRIWGIDAPEKGQSQGDEARRHMVDLTKGKTLKVVPRDIDRHGRLVAQVFEADLDIGLAMVRDGFALPETRFTRIYVSPMRKARRKRLGLWRYGAIQNPASYRKLHAKA